MTPKQQRFVQEYIIDLNATQAAIRTGYKKRSAYSQGQRLLKKDEVKKAVEKALEKRAERTQVTADKVLKEIAKIAYSDMRRIAEWNEEGVKVKDCMELSDEDAMCIAEIVQSDNANGRNIKVKLHDKEKALELLGRHLKLFTDNIKVLGDLSLRSDTMSDEEKMMLIKKVAQGE